MNSDRRSRLGVILRYLEQTNDLLEEIIEEETQAHDNTGHTDKLDYNIALLDASIKLLLASADIEAIAEGRLPTADKKEAPGSPTHYCPKCNTLRGAGTTRCWMKGCGDETSLDRCPTTPNDKQHHSVDGDDIERALGVLGDKDASHDAIAAALLILEHGK